MQPQVCCHCQAQWENRLASDRKKFVIPLQIIKVTPEEVSIGFIIVVMSMYNTMYK